MGGGETKYNRLTMFEYKYLEWGIKRLVNDHKHEVLRLLKDH